MVGADGTLTAVLKRNHVVDADIFFQGHQTGEGGFLYGFKNAAKGFSLVALDVHTLALTALPSTALPDKPPVNGYEIVTKVNPGGSLLAAGYEWGEVVGPDQVELYAELQITDLPSYQSVRRLKWHSSSPNATINSPSFQFTFISNKESLIIESLGSSFSVKASIMNVVTGASGPSSIQPLGPGNRQDNSLWQGIHSPAASAVYFTDNVRLSPGWKSPVYATSIWQIDVGQGTGAAPRIVVHEKQDNKLADSDSFAVRGGLLSIGNSLWTQIDAYHTI